MITIQGFARLCGCNTQTLRYYDRIGLMTPAKVDEWTGYRYYDEEQAMEFVKIKNLQKAEFSIEEIRSLLHEDDDGLMAAFERKIGEQERKLEQIREIQRSYLKETMDMQKLIIAMTDFVEGRMDDPVLWKEFGLDDGEETRIGAQVHEMLADWLTACRDASGEIAGSVPPDKIDTVRKVVDSLVTAGGDKPSGWMMEIAGAGQEPDGNVPGDALEVFERSGWAHVSEWLGELPDMSDGKQNYFVFRVRGDSPAADAAFPTLMLAVAASQYGAMTGGMYCNVARSDDGLNHFTLLRK